MKPVPRVGMKVRVVLLGAERTVVIEDVRDDGRTVVAGGQVFTLRTLTGRFVLEGDPYYGSRLVLDR
ncbi:MAG TPA: hypothetical protein VFB41_01450 [Solirubrobacteraceae bacterium]|nr:hypothetical protein [Solirubrobacteraceae bacterium]